MALPNLCCLETPFTKPHFSLSLPQKGQNPNPSPFLISLRSSPRLAKKPTTYLGLTSPLRCSIGRVDYEHERVVHPRPQEIPWSKDLANSVRLIGIVAAPVQIKHLSSGKVLAWTRLAVKKSATETTWVNLTLWDELAQVAFQHVEKGHQVYVAGRLVSDTVEGDEEKRQVYYKVVVQQLNFIEKSIPPVPLYPDTNLGISGAKLGNYVGNQSGSSTEELWQAFFANSVDWWDNRNTKRNPKAPDFKHKHTGEALWIEGKYNPHWVKSQLALLDTRMGSLQPNGARPAVSFMYGDDITPF